MVVAVLVLLAGCSDPPASDADPGVGSATQTSTDLDAGPRVVAVATMVPIDWSGRTKEGAWVCSDQSGTGQCPAGQQVMPDGEHVTQVAYQGNLTGIAVNMTWQADPSQTRLVLAAYGNTSAGFAMMGFARGPSPLSLQFAAGDIAEAVPDGLVTFMVWPEGKTPTAPSVYVDATRQSFTVEGHLTTLVDVIVREG